ncbi:MAG: glycoside hydrolase family 95 protein, partial [Puniceicoccales bacterium]|nr:glycoside hydrolase family 95 protein [Puniceicoccales bacterium]
MRPTSLLSRFSTAALASIAAIAAAGATGGAFAAVAAPAQLPMRWEYNAPAKKYWEGLPIGTGRFAAMIPGGVGREVIAFNDETFWTGGPY